MTQLERFRGDLKLNQHAKWVGGYLAQGHNYPITLEIDPTNQCPLDCVYCVWHDFLQETRVSLDDQTMSRVVKEAEGLGIKSLIWTGGGEPLAHTGTVSAIKLAASLGIENGMFTTGVPLTPEKTEALLDTLKWIRFHMASSDPAKYSRVHNVNRKKYDSVVGNILHFSRRRREKNSQVSIGIGTIALIDNLGDVQGLAMLTKDLGLDYFQYKHDLTQMGNPDYLQWWNSEVVPLMGLLSDQLETDSFKLQYSKGVDYTEPDPSKRCHAHHLSTAITADGNVAFCKSLRNQDEWSLGNINSGSLKSIFDSDQHEELKEIVTPSTCGVIPCPLKQTNQRLDQIVLSRDINLLDPSIRVEFSNFI